MKFQPLAAIATGEDPSVHCVLQWTLGCHTYIHQWAGVNLNLNLLPDIDPLLLRECIDADVATNRFTAAETFMRLVEVEFADCVFFAYDPYRFISVLESDFQINIAALHERCIDIRALAPPKDDGVPPTLPDIASHFGITYTPTGRSEDEAKVIRKIVEKQWKLTG